MNINALCQRKLKTTQIDKYNNMNQFFPDSEE